MVSRRTFIAAAAILSFSTEAHGDPPVDPSPARAAADRLVEAMGGAKAWSAAHGLRIAARHWESYQPPYDNLILMSLDEPLMRFEGDSASMRRRRAVKGETGWRVSEVSELGPMTAEQVKDDVRWWEAHVYRNIARLARRDEAVRPHLADDGRLELYRPDGVRLMWYRLNMSGEPVAYGQFDDDAGSILGPLAPVGGGINLPRWSANATGVFRAMIVEAAALPAAPEADYDRP